MAEHVLDRARRLWAEMGQDVPSNPVHDVSPDIDPRNLSPRARPQNLAADFELTIRGFIEDGRPHRIRPMIERMIQRRGLAVIQEIVHRSPNRDVITFQVSDLI